ncbi:MAG: hypothetical protein V3W18_11490 [candidate division Zixibacteria bacterium]
MVKFIRCGRGFFVTAKVLFSAILLIAIVFMTSSNLLAQTPSDFALGGYGGSYAPWGGSYLFSISTDGTFEYELIDLISGDVQQVTGTLLPADLDLIYAEVVAADFFNLNSSYDSGKMDGSGIVMEVTASNVTHAVEVKNYLLVEMNDIVCAINAIITSFGVELNYGTLDCSGGR